MTHPSTSGAAASGRSPGIGTEPVGSFDCDIAIIGGGVAALSAALFAAQLGRRTTVICDVLVGGQIINVEEITNFPGIAEPISGTDLAATIEGQAADAGAEFIFDDVSGLEQLDEGFHITGSSTSVRAATVIVATGSRLAKLSVPGESDLEGSGVSYCGSCDGPLFMQKPVIVVGGGDSAVEEALVVANYAESVTIVTAGSELIASAHAQAELRSRENITVIPDAVATAILGEGTVSGLRIRVNGAEADTELAAAGVFVFTGVVPNTDIVAGLVERDGDGRVVTDASMATTIPGIFAAGDIRRDSAGYLITAAGEGAQAALAAHRYLG